jgi:hypothetical protein
MPGNVENAIAISESSWLQVRHECYLRPENSSAVTSVPFSASNFSNRGVNANTLVIV